MTNNKIHHQGFILVIIMGLLGLLTIVSLSYFTISQQSQLLSETHLLKIKAKNLAFSGLSYGIEKYQQDITEFVEPQTTSLGHGTFKKDGDFYTIWIQDVNAKINLNDGLKAGQLEETVSSLDCGTVNFNNLNFTYDATALDPHPQGRQTNLLTDSQSKSALINLRLRRLLNAYGDAHRFTDFVCQGDLNNLSSCYGQPLPNPPFSVTAHNSSDAPLYEKTLVYVGDQIDFSTNNGLGDRIIMERPQTGYKNIIEVRDLVNAWSKKEDINLSSDYLMGKTFYNLIQNDLTVTSFEDESVFRLFLPEVGFDYAPNINLDQVKKGDFIPQDIQINPVSFLNSVMPHAVSLINLNQASLLVKAAVFYSLVNVRYWCQGATTIPPYLINSNSQEYFAENTAVEAMIAAPSIGTIGPVFGNNLETRENGTNQGRETHLMSLRDALHLATSYDQYLNTNDILNFDDFESFLKRHEITGWINNMIPPYERVPFEPFDQNQLQPLYDFNAGGHYHIAPYNSQGIFRQDYIRKTLPHVLSCVRRLPSILGTPIALRSPYMIHKPLINDVAYLEGELCQQSFRKVEDYVWRMVQPKVCFVSCGHTQTHSQGTIVNENNDSIAEHTINLKVDFFKTSYYRSERQFLNITNTDTSSEIVYGPTFAFIVDPQNLLIGNPHWGVIGLKDFDKDYFDSSVQTGLDPFMRINDTGYRPQIAMDFRNLFGDVWGGLDNYDGQQNLPRIMPIFQSAQDQWAMALNTTYTPSPYEGLDQAECFVNGVPNYYFGQVKGSWYDYFYEKSVDISTFNGLLLSSCSHGEFAQHPIENSVSPFVDSFYIRLHDWLNHYSGQAIGKAFNRGVMTFWFQLPGDYDYPTHVKTGDSHIIESESFSRILAHLNLWERYEHAATSPNNEWVRPVSLSIGLKKTYQQGLCVFARYDSGGEHHDGSSYQGFPFYLYTGASPFANIMQLPLSDFDVLSPIENLAGFWCGDTEGMTLDHDSFRAIAHRSAEVRVPFASKIECAPGSWHRISVYWNFGWDGHSPLLVEDQLFIDLHDASNKASDEHVFDQDVAKPNFGYQLKDHFNYPQVSNPNDNGVHKGFMLPFDSSMILSFGEAHGRRLGPYSLNSWTRKKDNDNATNEFFNPEKTTLTSTAGKYYPYWRLNSCIDNIRVWFGPEQLSPDQQIPEEYFKPDFVSSHDSLYTALRYEITHSDHGFTTSNQPVWALGVNTFYGIPIKWIPDKSKVVALGSRIYYPPDNNTSYVYVSLRPSYRANEDNSFTPIKISQNEQDLFYASEVIDDNFRVIFQYTAFQPSFDADQSNRQNDPLIYHGSDHFTEIPWIKEISIRYTPPEGITFSNWEENNQ